MLARLNSFALNGINGNNITIEVDINAGIPSCDVVGLPDTAVKESKERVRSAIKNSGYQFPMKRITVNLAPADTKKEGAFFDLPIALAILIASEQLLTSTYKDYVFVGELSLSGNVNAVKGILPILISGLQKGYKKFIIPSGNSKEASFVEGIEVYAVDSLSQCASFLKGNILLDAIPSIAYTDSLLVNKYGLDMSDVKGQTVAKRALEIAVAGGHNLLMIGPPGTGKTMLAKCVPTIMPPMTYGEAIEVTKVYSVSGLIDRNVGIVTNRPFRTPHHTATMQSLIGGGAKAKPGEISLAHNGVLFLDEMPEYSRKTLEVLRQPLEDGVITVSRVQNSCEYPANFMLIASMNPCPCGNFGSTTHECTCSSAQIHNYLSKLSGPLLDRIDLHVEVDTITFDELRHVPQAESSETIRKRIINARNIELKRFEGSETHVNARMTSSQVKKYCKLDEKCEKLLKMAFDKLNLSARGINRVLKVARTIADLSGNNDITELNIAEAIQYRTLDRKYRV